MFLPIATMLCVVFGLIIFYQYKREADYRSKMFVAELQLIDNSIIDAYHNDVNLRTFLSFIRQFFKESVFDGVRFSVYVDKRLYYSLGVPIPYDVSELGLSGRMIADGADGSSVRLLDSGDEGLYFLSTAKSDDGRMEIRTVMPYNKDVHEALVIDRRVWIVIAVCLAVTLIVIFISTRALSRNILLLKDFAYRAATGGRFTGEDSFPRNELGDISREIVKLYRDRSKAIEQLNRERKVAIHAVEEKVRVTRQMTNNINHEIKTPVGIIRGYLETILSDPDMDIETRTHFLERMLINVERLTTLLNDVSTMTRLESGSGMIALERVNMHELVYQINNDLPASNIAGKMTFDFNIPMDCEVKGNYNLLHGMLCGLIRNSSMHSGGTEIFLKVISENERFYVFSFSDNGAGVGDEHLTHLFERFYRVDTGRSRKAGGTGLGLPIVKSTIVSLGGTISVRNRSTGGLEFLFTIPRWTESGYDS